MSIEETLNPEPIDDDQSDSVGGVKRKVRQGIVVSTSMDKTAVVATTSRVRHPKYGKIIKRTKRLHVHDQDNTLKVGDQVRVIECRPLSKLKRWRLLEVMETAR